MFVTNYREDLAAFSKDPTYPTLSFWITLFLIYTWPTCLTLSQTYINCVKCSRESREKSERGVETRVGVGRKSIHSLRRKWSWEEVLFPFHQGSFKSTTVSDSVVRVSSKRRKTKDHVPSYNVTIWLYCLAYPIIHEIQFFMLNYYCTML